MEVRGHASGVQTTCQRRVSRRAGASDGCGAPVVARTATLRGIAPADPQPGDQQAEDRLHSELGELLNAIRVALPGVQVLFAFLIAVPFSNRFSKVTTLERDAYIAALLSAGIASILLIAPSAHHRLRWRLPVEEKALIWGNRLLVIGTLFLALAMVGAVFFVTDVLLGPSGAIAITACLATACALIWYTLPLTWRSASPPKATPLD